MAEGRKGFLADRSINRVWERLGGSFHSKATGLLDGREQLLVELLVALVRGNVDPVEAGGGSREVSALQPSLPGLPHLTELHTVPARLNEATQLQLNKSHLQFSHLCCSVRDSFDYVIKEKRSKTAPNTLTADWS